MRKKIFIISGLVLCLFLGSYAFIPSNKIFNNIESDRNRIVHDTYDSKINPKLAQISGNFSNYNLSVIMDEANSMVKGNLTVDFYNNDNVNFTRIPFHIYLSGMDYDIRLGSIVIINVTDIDTPSISFPFEVHAPNQIMWVNLSETLEPQKRTQFIIQFNATIPDGGIDRANSHGTDVNSSRIFKFAHFYPIPCVYDTEDKWNIDPYLDIGDPFYFDMAYYNFFIEAPSEMVVAATGNLAEYINKGATTWYHYNPVYPVREVTFSASRYFQIQSKIVNGVNLSTYFLSNHFDLWNINALHYAERALILFNNSFGAYPYPTLNVVEEYTHYGGMEYPNQVYITEALVGWGDINYQKWYLEKIIVHEIAHQWWYNLIGNDEVDVGFLDEGLTCWSTDYYGEFYYSNWEYFQSQRYIDRVRTYFAYEGLSSKINQSAYELLSSGTNWVYVSYQKAPLIFEKLRQSIGPTTFLEGLKLYFERNQFDLVLLSDLQQAFEDVVEQSLDWFFFPWFDNYLLPKYAITRNIYDVETQKLELTIVDVTEPWNDYNYSQQVPLSVYDASNSWIFSQTVWINGTTELSFDISTTPNKVSLMYNNYVLVQLADEFTLSLDSSVKLVNQGIFSLEMIFILMIIVFSIGFALYYYRRKIKNRS